MDIKQVIKNFARWTKLYSNFWNIYLRRIGVLSDPYLLKLREGPKYWIRRDRGDRGILKEVYEEGEYKDIDYSDYDVVMDVGAHIGVFSLETAKKNTKVVSYEPDPQTYQILKKNINENNLENIEAKNKAISTTKGEINLYIGADSLTNSTTSETSKSISVNSLTLKDASNKFNISNQKTLLKLDCEGEEFNIISESPESLLENFDKIIIEYHRHSGEEKELAQKLEMAGFKTKKLNNDNSGIIVATND
ncbi:MAG: FkbM family methyltransferase [Candidatus Nanohalobium sp.]